MSASLDSDLPICPQCGTNEAVVPIAYGLPGDEMKAAGSRGEIVLGGCTPRFNRTHFCKRCEMDFARPRSKP